MFNNIPTVKYLNTYFKTNSIYLNLLLIAIFLLVVVEIAIYFRPLKVLKKSIEKPNNKEFDIPNNIIKHNINNYEVFEIFDILTSEECDKLIELAKNKGLDNSVVLSYDNSKTTLDINHRKSKQTWFLDNYDPLFAKLSNITATITKKPVENQEMTQVAMYETGGRFGAHFDACNSDDKIYCNEVNKNAGERKATLLIYLNDNFEGGETEFTEINLKIKPKKGKGIYFINVDDNEVIYQLSMHKGNEITKGEKWIATKWTHFRQYN